LELDIMMLQICINFTKVSFLVLYKLLNSSPCSIMIEDLVKHVFRALKNSHFPLILKLLSNDSMAKSWPITNLFQKLLITFQKYRKYYSSKASMLVILFVVFNLLALVYSTVSNIFIKSNYQENQLYQILYLG